MTQQLKTPRTVGKGHRFFMFVVFVVLASLDNAAAGVLPPLYAIIARDFATSEAALGLVTAVYFLILAAAAAFWGYRGDRAGRKNLLFYGTIGWGGAMCLTGLAQTFWQFLLFQMITAVGVGSISAVGFSVVTDIIPPHRRGFALSLWSMSQVLGGAAGALLASTLGATHWRRPFFLIAAAGFFFAFLFLFTREPQRGQAEPELASLFNSGRFYEYPIVPADIPKILARRSNIWLMGQNFLAALAFGSTVWVPRWAIARVEAEGYSLEIATIVGNLFVMLFSVGIFFSIPAGQLGDRWQQRQAHARPILAAVGLLGSIPFFILLYFLPLQDVFLPPNSDLLAILGAIFINLGTNGWVAGAFLVALIGMALFSAEPPNRAAILTDVNLPEHRGTVIGINRIFAALGNALSVGLTGLIIMLLTAEFAPPTNYAVGLALFQLLVIPAGLCYIGISKNVARDTAAVKQILAERVEILGY